MLFSFHKMNWIVVCVIYMNLAVLQARHEFNIKKLIDKIKRRNSMHRFSPILGAPKYPEHLPEAEPLLPGHTLIRPAKGMLKSAIKFPLRDLGGSVVYGNTANIGLSDGNSRVMYSDFRKMTKDELLLNKLAYVIQEEKKKENRPLFSIGKMMVYSPGRFRPGESVYGHTDIEDNAREIINVLDPTREFFEDHVDVPVIKNLRKNSRSKHRKRNRKDDYSSSSSDSSSGSSENERNPGNPYTIHKNKYKQNWLWNHFVRINGDHMNINPNAPMFKGEEPTGPELFFGRKWWYFNQDDYKPMK